jgi:ubiquitin-protein ligase
MASAVFAFPFLTSKPAMSERTNEQKCMTRDVSQVLGGNSLQTVEEAISECPCATYYKNMFPVLVRSKDDYPFPPSMRAPGTTTKIDLLRDALLRTTVLRSGYSEEAQSYDRMASLAYIVQHIKRVLQKALQDRRVLADKVYITMCRAWINYEADDVIELCIGMTSTNDAHHSTPRDKNRPYTTIVNATVDVRARDLTLTHSHCHPDTLLRNNATLATLLKYFILGAT